MTELTEAQQVWEDEYTALYDDFIRIRDAISDAENNGLENTDAYNQAYVYRLQLEHAINQHIEAAYEDVELNDLYWQYQDSKFGYGHINYNGIEYNNIGTPLELDTTHWRGMYYYIDQKLVEFLDEFSADYDAFSSFALDHIISPMAWLKPPKITSPYGAYDDIAQAHFETALGYALPVQTLGERAWEAFKDGRYFDSSITATDIFSRLFFDNTPANVVTVSADVLKDELTGEAYYLARVKVAESMLQELQSNVKLYPGMPAQVFMVGGARSLFNYLFTPITDATYKAFREE